MTRTARSAGDVSALVRDLARDRLQITETWKEKRMDDLRRRLVLVEAAVVTLLIVIAITGVTLAIVL